MNLIEEQIKAYENMIKYLQRQIDRLKKKSKNANNEVFADKCCMHITKDHRTRLPIAFKGS